MCWRVPYIFAGRSCTIRNVFHAKATRVIAEKRYREKEKVWRLWKVLFRKTTYRRVRLGSSMSAVCYWTVISNGSYGHLNNHLAHPPSLNLTLTISSLLCLFLCLFSQNLSTIRGTRSDDSRKTTALTGCPFFYRYRGTYYYLLPSEK